MGGVKQCESRSRSTSASLIFILSKKKRVSECCYPELKAEYLDMATNLPFVVAIAICCGLVMAEALECYKEKDKKNTKETCGPNLDTCQFTKEGGRSMQQDAVVKRCLNKLQRNVL